MNIESKSWQWLSFAIIIIVIINLSNNLAWIVGHIYLLLCSISSWSRPGELTWRTLINDLNYRDNQCKTYHPGDLLDGSNNIAVPLVCEYIFGQNSKYAKIKYLFTFSWWLLMFLTLPWWFTLKVTPSLALMLSM